MNTSRTRSSWSTNRISRSQPGREKSPLRQELVLAFTYSFWSMRLALPAPVVINMARLKEAVLWTV